MGSTIGFNRIPRTTRLGDAACDRIADDRVERLNRALAALLAAVLAPPGVTQTLARRQLQSRYLEKLPARSAD